MEKKKILFVCQYGMVRSRLAAEIYEFKHDVSYAGINIDAAIQFTQEMGDAFDIIVAMAPDIGKSLDHYGYGEKLITLDIDENFVMVDEIILQKEIKRQLEGLLW